MPVNSQVLVLNQNYVPLNICNVRRAVILVNRGKAEMLENGRGSIHTVSAVFPIPSVIRLVHLVKRPLLQRRISRRAVFHRDAGRCQYCGDSARQLTLDHVVPRSRKGPHVWENVVAACIPCNHKKAGRTPREAGMRLLCAPKAPRPNPFHVFDHRPILSEWRQFIPWAS